MKGHSNLLSLSNHAVVKLSFHKNWAWAAFPRKAQLVVRLSRRMGSLPITYCRHQLEILLAIIKEKTIEPFSKQLIFE